MTSGETIVADQRREVDVSRRGDSCMPSRDRKCRPHPGTFDRAEHLRRLSSACSCRSPCNTPRRLRRRRPRRARIRMSKICRPRPRRPPWCRSTTDRPSRRASPSNSPTRAKRASRSRMDCCPAVLCGTCRTVRCRSRVLLSSRGAVISYGETCELARSSGPSAPNTLVRNGKRPVKNVARLVEHAGIAQALPKRTPARAMRSMLGVLGGVTLPYCSGARSQVLLDGAKS